MTLDYPQPQKLNMSAAGKLRTLKELAALECTLCHYLSNTSDSHSATHRFCAASAGSSEARLFFKATSSLATAETGSVSAPPAWLLPAAALAAAAASPAPCLSDITVWSLVVQAEARSRDCTCICGSCLA